MDPNATVARIVKRLRFISESGFPGNAEEIGESIVNLVDWLEAGGYVPSNLDSLITLED